MYSIHKKYGILFLYCLRGKQLIIKERSDNFYMSRTKRQYNDIRVYHIIFRGIDRQDIFLENKDKEKIFANIKR